MIYSFIQKFLLIKYIQVMTVFFAKQSWDSFLQERGLNNKTISFVPDRDKLVADAFKNLFTGKEANEKITLVSVSKTYENGFKAVDDFSLEINPREFVCLLGPSGCGKTTVLRMIAGLDLITGGKYFQGSSEMNTAPPSQRNTAMVFQNYALYPFMTVYKNIAFGLKLKTYNNDFFIKKINQLISFNAPLREEIADLRFEVRSLKHPLQIEIRQVQIALKKAQITRNKDDSKNFSSQLLNLREKKKEIVSESSDVIQQKKKQLKALVSEQKRLSSENRRLARENVKKIKLEIIRLKSESRVYYASHKSELVVLKKQIRDLQKRRKNLAQESTKFLKEKRRLLKKARKNEQEIDLINKEIGEHNTKFESSLDQIGSERLLLDQKRLIILNNKRFDIEELWKNAGQSRSSIIRESIKLAVVWRKSIPYRVGDLARIVGIENFLNRKPAALSGGQRQRVALIRAISKDARLFLFDEPLSNLDAKLRSSMRTEIRRIHDRQGATSIYVTHDQIEAMTMATKVVVMNLGYIQQVGSPKDLYDNPNNVFVARFIGTPSINMLRGVLKSNKLIVDGQFLETKKILTEKSEENRQVLFAIRPQDVYPQNDQTAGSWKGEIEISELLGAEYIVTVKSSIGRLKLIAPNNFNVEQGRIIDFKIDYSKAHVFDFFTGHSLTSQVNDETKQAQIVWEQGKEERIKNKVLLQKERKQKKTVMGLIGSSASSLMSSAEEKREKVQLDVEKKGQKIEDYKSVELDDGAEETEISS